MNTRAKYNSDKSGIQTWSRFVPVTTQDCWELGYIHGSNGIAYDSTQAGEARHVEGYTAYGDGYFEGSKSFKPFDDNGRVRDE